MLKPLFESNVFRMLIEAELWPQQHQVTDRLLRGYSDNIFDLKFKYPQVFPNFSKIKVQKSAKFSIEYGAYLFTSMEQSKEDEITGEKLRLVDALSESTDLALFETQVVKDVINFKWQQFARRIHYFGAFMHFSYAIALFYYVKDVFVR